MKTYYVTFPGMWLEGYAVVTAESADAAAAKVQAEAIKHGLSRPRRKDLTINEIPNTMGIHKFYNGDY